MRFSRELLENELASIIDPALAEQVCRAYVAMQQRFHSGDWGPAELDGGQFCEAAVRAIYQLDTGQITTELPGKVSELLMDRVKVPIAHKLDRKDRDHFCRVLGMTYKFRNDRGVAHISPTYTANHADASLIMASVKWMFAEFLRLGWNSDRNQVGEIIEAIVQLEHPLVHELDGRPLILSTSLSASQEVLILLNRSEGGRLSRAELRTFVRKTSNAVSTAISRLITTREVRVSDDGEIVITPLGEQKVREEIMPRLQSLDTTNPVASKTSAKAKARKR